MASLSVVGIPGGARLDKCTGILRNSRRYRFRAKYGDKCGHHKTNRTAPVSAPVPAPPVHEHAPTPPVPEQVTTPRDVNIQPKGYGLYLNIREANPAY